MKLNYKQCDIQRNDLVGLTKNFYPQARLDKIEVFFIPIKNQKTNKFIPDLFVIKIHISASDRRIFICRWKFKTRNVFSN